MVNSQSLIGKTWVYGVQDCYTVVRAYYRLMGIDLPEFERPKDLQRTESIFLDNAPRLGFAEVEFEDRQGSDLLVMRLGTRTPMHGGIYLPGDRILHQRTNSVSAIEPLRQYYRQRVAVVYRHATCNAGR